MLDPLPAIDLFFERSFIPIFFLFVVLALFTLRRRSVLMMALVLTLLVVPVAKTVYDQARPCSDLGIAGSGDYKFACPSDGGLPSAHTASFALLAIASLGTLWFFLFAPLAALVAFTRIHSYVHSLEQVAAGAALAVTLYFLSFSIRSLFSIHRAHRKPEPHYVKTGGADEYNRQLVHIAIGASTIIIGIVIGKSILIAALVVLLAAGLVLINLKMMGSRLQVIDSILEKLERPNAWPGKGALFHITGFILALTFTGDYAFSLGVIAIQSFGDGFSTILGIRYGKTKIPWNQRKSIVGTTAFLFTGGIAAYPFIGPVAFAYSTFLAIVETIPVEVDDNLLIPIAAVLVNRLFGA